MRHSYMIQSLLGGMLNKFLTLRGKAIVALACVGLLAPAAEQAEPQQPTGKPELISPERAAMVEEMLYNLRRAWDEMH